SLRDKEGKMPEYPIAPIEAQGYGWLALKLWSDFYGDTSRSGLHNTSFAQKISSYADQMKEQFNRTFLIKDGDLFFGAQALDGYKRQIKTVTGNPLLLLWASRVKNGEVECILDEAYVADFVKRAFAPDLFDKDAGIRTMSAL